MGAGVRDRRGRSGMEKTPRGSLLFRVGACLILLGLIGYSIYQCTGHITMGMETLPTQEITESSYVGLDLYVFRDEEPITVNGNLFAYDVEDGQKVGADSQVLTAYRVPDPKDGQAVLDAYQGRLAWITDRAHGGTMGEVIALNHAMDVGYLSMLAEKDRGNLSGVFGYAEGILDGMNRYDALTGSEEHEGLTVESIQAERAEVLSGLVETDAFHAAESGYFYYDIDGYETLFDPTLVMTMTPEEFHVLTETSPLATSEETAGKVVYSATWYGAAFLPAADAQIFSDNYEAGKSVYRVTCTDGGNTELVLELERLEYTEDGALLVFSSCSMPDGFDFSRRIRVETVMHTVSGYRIPTEAVVTLTDEDGQPLRGVYILEGNLVEFRRIGVLRDHGGYLIVRTYEEEMARVEAMDEAQQEVYNAQEYAYLQMNDNMIIRGTGLYHGKMMG